MIWRARAAPRPIASRRARRSGSSVVAEILGDHDRAALGDDQRLGELVRRDGGEALHRAAVLAEVVDQRLELLGPALQPGRLAARLGGGAVLGVRS